MAKYCKIINIPCTICGKAMYKKTYCKEHRKPKPCKPCANKINYPPKHEDFIEVLHKAGDRDSQIVRKYRLFCPTCKKDKGYGFLSAKNHECRKCSFKHRKTPKERAHNYAGIESKLNNPLQGEIRLRSSYETFYAEYLLNKGTNFLYEAKRFKLSNGTSYTPDFYLVDKKVYVELKGRDNEEFRKKLELFKKDYKKEKIIVLTLNELKKLGYIKNSVLNHFTIKIKGDKWTIKLLDARKYKKLIGADSTALCDPINKTISYQEGHVDFDTISHEVWHAYMTYTRTSSAKIDQCAMEEISAEVYGNDCFKMMAHSFLILGHFRDILKNRFRIKEETIVEHADFDKEQCKRLTKAFRNIKFKISSTELKVTLRKKVIIHKIKKK